MLVSECEKMHKQGRIKGDTTGAIASARRCKGIPVMKFICFKEYTRLKFFQESENIADL